MIRPIGLAALLCFPCSAFAGLTASVDLGKAVDSHFEQDVGMRVGYTINLVNLHITPEISERLLLAGTETALGTFVGARATLGFLVAPGVYAQTGVWTYDQSSSTTGGLTLDFRGVPMAILGAHGGYTTHVKGNFISGGVHAGIEF
jgi:hypothetical protein